MEEKTDNKDTHPLEKNDVPQPIDEDNSKTTDVDLSSDEKKENDAANKSEDASQNEEEATNPLKNIEDEKAALTKDVMEMRKSSLPCLRERSLKRAHQRRIQYCKI